MDASKWSKVLRACAATVVLLVGCGGDDDDGDGASLTVGGAGDSCTRTADCGAGLRCFGNVCAVAATTGDAGPPMQALGGEGENCAARSDCAANLACFDGRCTSSPAGPGSPSLGKRGETCQVASDCDAGLTCVDVVVTSGFSGVVQSICDIAEYPLEPTGKTCSSECREASDCCELPVAVHELGIASCAALTESLAAVNCATTIDPIEQGRCFNRATYCLCAGDPWTCTAGKCEYAAACTASGSVPGGCPTYSRSQRVLPSSCNATSHRCEALAVGCADDAACLGAPVTDDPFDSCNTGECTCFQHSSCLRVCDDELDCAARQTCDAATHVCVDSPQCEVGNDATCTQLLGEVTAECVEGTCKLPCTSDRQCSPSGFGSSSFSGVVCGPTGFCESLGCTSDAECGVAGGVHLFCDTPPPAAAVASAHSALTSGH